MGGSARIVSVYFTTEEIDALNALCRETTQTPQIIIKKSVMHLLRENEKRKPKRQPQNSDEKSGEALTA